MDGVLKYRAAEETGKVVLSVKSGRQLAPAMVRELRGTREAESATIGVLVTMFEPSREMKDAAIRAGFLRVGDREYPRIQLLSVKDIFAGKRIQHPGEAVRAPSGAAEKGSLYLPGFEKPLPARKGVRIRTGGTVPPTTDAIAASPRKGPRSAPSLESAQRTKSGRRR